MYSCKRRILATSFAVIVFVSTAQSLIAQSEKLGIVNYSPPPGMAKRIKENVVTFSRIDAASGKYCLLTLYGPTPGTGTPAGDFTRDWNNVVLKNMTANKNPRTEVQKDGEWTAVSGGSEVESTELGKAVAFLTVISGLRTAVSVLAVFNDPGCAKPVDELVASIHIDKPAPPAPANNTVVSSGPLALDTDGHIIMPEPTRAFTVADLAGVWEEGSRSSTSYVFRATGDHAGTDSLAIRITRTIRSDGSFSSDFFSIRNGKKERDITTGRITIVGRVLTVHRTNSPTTDKYVIRGWLETPTTTILRLAEGPWHNDDVIPQDRFTDFSDFGRFFPKTHWIRKK
jgi:hypothetical protein